MEATIRTNDRNAFYSLINFLKAVHFEVEIKEKKNLSGTSRKKLINIIRKGADGRKRAHKN